MLSRYLLNFFSHAGATAAASVVQLASMMAIGRLMPVEDFAKYAMMAAIVAIGEMASDFGGRIWAIKAFAHEDSKSGAFRSCLRVKSFFSVLGLVLLVAIPLPRLAPVDRLLCGMIAFTQPSTDPFLWYLNGIERLSLESALSFLNRMAASAAMVSAAFAGCQIDALMGVWLAINIARLVIESRLAIMLPLYAKPAGERPPLRTLLREIIPIGSGFLLMTLYARIGVIAIAALASARAAADYAVAFTLVASSGFVATSVITTYFPAISRALHRRDERECADLVGRKLSMIALIFVPACLIGIASGPTIIVLVYGRAFSGAGSLAVIFTAGLFISIFNYSFKFVLNAASLNRSDITSVGVGIAAYAAVIAFGRADLPTASAIGWGIGEFAMLMVKLRALRANGYVHLCPRPRTFALMAMIVVAASAQVLYLRSGL